MINISYLILFLLVIIFSVQLKWMLKARLKKARNFYDRIKRDYDQAQAENERLHKEREALVRKFEETVGLYDVTREICKTLDKKNIIANFCSYLNRTIDVGNCRVVSEGGKASGCVMLPLRLDRHSSFYLALDRLREEDKEKLSILTEQLALGFRRAVLYEQVQEMAITDSLTGAFSRRYLLDRLREESVRSQKLKYKYSFLMVDIDNFKHYNDHYGHLVGDAILKEVARTIKENIRQIDLLGRYGGEEFCLILTETDRDGAYLAAERTRQSIAQKHIRVYDEDVQVTISIGIAVFPDDAGEESSLIERADQALYQAKQTGRNKVCIYSSPNIPPQA